MDLAGLFSVCTAAEDGQGGGGMQSTDTQSSLQSRGPLYFASIKQTAAFGAKVQE